MLGRGEVNTGGHGKSSILADTLESLIGAVYLQHGLAGARGVILRLFDELLDTAPTLGAALEWKSSLQELTATRGLGVPRYEVTSEGPDHDRRFTAVVDGQRRAVSAAGWAGPRRPPRPRPPRRPGRPWTPCPKGPASRLTPPLPSWMPELPEVEVVRRGLQAHLAGRSITAVRVHHPRAVRRHEGGAADLTARLLGARITGTDRRGKYLWLNLVEGGDDELDSDESALVVHLGMSGQMLLGSITNTNHLRIAALLDDGTALSFVDQRTFGGWQLADLVSVDGSRLPVPVAHIARDPLDPRFDRSAVVDVLRRKHSEIKRQLLDQTVVSGIGNIYADEALWRAGVNGARIAAKLTRRQLAEVLDAAAEVMREALGQGGTSFDSLYVNVNGQSGYFDRSLNVYGREDRNCRRCGAVIRREKFMNRSSFYCPVCQPRPRRG